MCVGEHDLVRVACPTEVRDHLLKRIHRMTGRIPGTDHAGNGVVGDLAPAWGAGHPPALGLLRASPVIARLDPGVAPHVEQAAVEALARSAIQAAACSTALTGAVPTRIAWANVWNPAKARLCA